MRRTTGALGGLIAVALLGGCSSSQSTEELYQEGDGHFDAGRYGEAIPPYTEILTREDAAGEAALKRGVSQERSGNAQAAFSDYSEASQSGESSALAFSANLHMQQGNLAAAEADLGQMRGLALSARGRVHYLALLGELRLKQGRNGQAIQNLEQAISEGASFSDPLGARAVTTSKYNAAMAHFALGDFGRAYDHMLSFAQRVGGPSALGPRDAYQLGLLAYLIGDFSGSSTYLSYADPSLVARAQQVLNDPSFGAAPREAAQ